MKELRDLKDLTIHDVQPMGWINWFYLIAPPPGSTGIFSFSLLLSSLELSDTQIL